MKKLVLVDTAGLVEDTIVGVFNNKKAVNTFLKETCGLAYNEYRKSHGDDKTVSYDEWLGMNDFYIEELKKNEDC